MKNATVRGNLVNMVRVKFTCFAAASDNMGRLLNFKRLMETRRCAN